MSDYGLELKILDAQDRVFCYMVEEGHDKATGSHALRPFGMDWQDAWENWWDEGEDA